MNVSIAMSRLALVLLLAGCAGGSAVHQALPPTIAPQSKTTTLNFVIRVPEANKAGNATGTRRHPAFISASTQSLSVAIDGGTPTPQNLTATSPNCAVPAPLSPLTCTIQTAITPGAHTFVISTFDQPNATGNELSTGSLMKTIVAGQANAVNVILNGIAASLIVTPTTASTVVVKPPNSVQLLGGSTQTLLVAAVDADDNLIVGPGAPAITATVTNPSTGSGISITPVPNSANAFTLTSAGLDNATVTFSAAVPSSTPIVTALAVQGIAQTSTLAGTPSVFGVSDGTGAAAAFNFPTLLAYNPNDGNLYVTDSNNCAIRPVSPTTGVVTTIAGSKVGICGFADGTGTNAMFDFPSGIAYDANDGNLYVTDTNNCNIRQVNPTTGAVVTIAGSTTRTCAFADGTGTNAMFRFPQGIAYNAKDHNLYVTDADNCNIRQVNPVSGTVVTIAGSTARTCGFADGTGASALFDFPSGIAYNPTDGNLYVTDTDNCNIRQINPTTGAVVTIAGSITQACGVNDGTGTNARFTLPSGIAYNTNDLRLYVTDQSNCNVRQVDPTTGAVATIAGSVTQRCGFADGLVALFACPKGIAFDPVNGNLYVTDANNSIIRQMQL